MKKERRTLSPSCKIIVASIGRCGSGLLTRLIVKSTGRVKGFAASYDQLYKAGGAVEKTHLHFTGTLNYDYRVIFIYGDIENIIASLYSIHGDSHFHQRQLEQMEIPLRDWKKPLSMLWDAFLTRHLRYLCVKNEHIHNFFKIAHFSKLAAFLYLIIGDKLRFKENMESWKHSKSVLFIKYEALCSNKKEVLQHISDFLGVDLCNFEIQKRHSSKSDLPMLLRIVIKRVYKKGVSARVCQHFSDSYPQR